MTDTDETRFAPAGRDPPEAVREQAGRLKSQAAWDLVLDLVPSVCFVVNASRQVVLANRALLDRLGLTEGELLGARPGEIIDCIHARELPGGCGSTEACRYCGTVGAILDAFASGKRAERECRITARKDGSLSSLELHVTVTPIIRDGERMALVALDDISDRKRREVLERLFFHDIMNSLASIQAAVTLISEDFGPEIGASPFYEGLRSATEGLIDEVNRQREILTMERGDLEPKPGPVDIAALAAETAAQMEHAEWARSKTAILDTSGGPVVVETDRVILRRVIGNMLKNAFEATPDGGRIGLKVAAEEDGAAVLVHNDGCMAEEVRLQVFQRSFSTKGKGRGLGTWSMRILTEEYLGGSVNFTSTETEGTIFRIRLPGKWEGTWKREP